MRGRWDRQEKRRRWVATASTWVAKATAILRAQQDAPEAERTLLAHDASRLLYNIMDAADELVRGPLSDLDSDPYFDLTLIYAERVLATLRGRSAQAKLDDLIARLEDVTGRTPEEASMFRRKAAELRARVAS